MEKLYDDWNTKKRDLNSRISQYFNEAEIWWVSIGINVGVEIDGKGRNYSRPVLILKKFNMHAFLGIPLSSVGKVGKFIFTINEVYDKTAFANISQIRVFSSKRLGTRMCLLEYNQFTSIKRNIRDIIFSDIS